MTYTKNSDLVVPVHEILMEATGLPANRVINADQGREVPAENCVFFKVRQDMALGQPKAKRTLVDPVSPTDLPNWKDYQIDYTQNNRVKVSINCYGPDAQEAAADIQKMAWRYNVKQKIDSALLGFVDSTAPNDLTALVDADYQQRYQLEIRFLYDRLIRSQVERIHSVEYTVNDQLGEELAKGEVTIDDV